MKKTKALYLAEEGIEMLRYLRDDDWNYLESSLNRDTIYYFDPSASDINVTGSPEIIDSDYYREFEWS